MDYKRILALHYTNGMSGREIAEATGAGKTTVNEFLKRFRECSELSYHLPEEVTKLCSQGDDGAAHTGFGVYPTGIQPDKDQNIRSRRPLRYQRELFPADLLQLHGLLTHPVHPESAAQLRKKSAAVGNVHSQRGGCAVRLSGRLLFQPRIQEIGGSFALRICKREGQR